MSKGPRSPIRSQTRTLNAQQVRHRASVKDIWAQFSPDALEGICVMPERLFADAFDLATVTVEQSSPDDFFAFKDNGSNILAVAHLDTVSAPPSRACHFLDTADGWVVYSRALDDRLGAYIILDLLPKLGMTFDTLLTVGEESGQSTAAFFSSQKKYDWMIEFDRGGTDVVMYQYDDSSTADLVSACGTRVGDGSFSDISYLEHLGAKAFNWGVGYQDYHSARSHAFLDDTVTMVAHFIEFYRVNKDVSLPHEITDDFGLGEPPAGQSFWYGDSISILKTELARAVGTPHQFPVGWKSMHDKLRVTRRWSLRTGTSPRSPKGLGLNRFRQWRERRDVRPR